MSAISSFFSRLTSSFTTVQPPAKILLNRYPDITHWTRQSLEVAPGWNISYTEVGNPNGIPVLFVHGGPGYAFKATDLCWFNPEKYRIIAFDQRGSGCSSPSAQNYKDGEPGIYKNIGINDFVADMEKLRKHLSIEKWLLFGGSWGSTLSLYYAQNHPQSCMGLVLRGIFLATEAENKAYFNPELLKETPNWNPQAIMALKYYAQGKTLPFNLEDSHQCVETYRNLIIEEEDCIATHLWVAYESYMDEPTPANLKALLRIPLSVEQLDPLERAQGIFETIFFSKLPSEINLLDHSAIMNLKDVPIKIVQGMTDTETPPEFANKLVEALQNAKVSCTVDWIKQGAHTPYEDFMTNALVRATTQFAQTLQ